MQRSSAGQVVAFVNIGYSDTVNRGDGPGEMGEALPAVDIENSLRGQLFYF